jgi:hypothetical protein
MDSLTNPNRRLSEGNLGNVAAQQQIAALNQQVEELHTHIQTLTANQPCTCPLKINPKEFSGARLEARSFLAQCELAFRANPNNFPSDDAKVVYGASYLCKDVFLWYQTHLAMRRSIRSYVRSCDACLHAKATRHKPYRLLKPLPIPTKCWHDVSLDFVFGLPLSSGFDSILVVKDRLSKRTHYLPCLTTINAPETADLFSCEIFRLHGLPKTIVSDRGPQFASKFWKRLFEVLGVDIRLSTTFHPETDGSTKVTNQVMEQYLRIFCNFKQNDWFQFLPLAEFTYNNSVNSTTKLTPFFPDAGVNPLFDPAIPPSSTVPSAEHREREIKSTIRTLCDTLRAQHCYSHYANCARLLVPNSFKVGGLVYLD